MLKRKEISPEANPTLNPDEANKPAAGPKLLKIRKNISPDAPTIGGGKAPPTIRLKGSPDCRGLQSVASISRIVVSPEKIIKDKVSPDRVTTASSANTRVGTNEAKISPDNSRLATSSQTTEKSSDLSKKVSPTRFKFNFNTNAFEEVAVNVGKKGK